MEYPFKDLMPLDEATARDGYYKDWTHLDPEVFYSLTQISEYIKTKGYGVDVRLLIAQLAEHFGLKSTQIVDLANLLSEKHDALKAQFDDVIANATVDSEVILARGGKATLGQRLDETTAQLEQNNNKWLDIIPPGILKLPNDFKLSYDGFEFPFNIIKNLDGTFTHNATPQNQFDWSNATNIYIKAIGGTSTTGLEEDKPISIARFKQNLTDGLYSSTNTFILNILEDVSCERSPVTLQDLNLYIKSKSQSGFSWIGRTLMPGVNPIVSAANYMTDWVLENGVYVANKKTGEKIINLVNYYDNLDFCNTPRIYTEVTSLEAMTKEGQFYQEAYKIYCKPYSDEVMSNLGAVVHGSGNTGLTITLTSSSNNTVVFENIGFATEEVKFSTTNNKSKLYFFNCKFFRGLQDAIGFTKRYQSYMFNCIASYGSKDNFNYHATDQESLAFEYNCISYGAGKYKMSGGNTTTHSNNGSTSHESIHVLRVGGIYFDCEGPVIADVGNCYSINIGVNVGSCAKTNSGVKSAFYFDVTNTQKNPNLVPQYIIECKTRKGYNQLAVKGTENTFIGGLKGFSKTDGNIRYLESWEDID